VSDFTWAEDKQDAFGWRSDPFEDQPIDVPLGDVAGVPRKCVEIAEDWVPIIISALERLKFGDMWNGDDADLQRAYQNIDTLQSMLSTGDCEGGNFDYDCESLPLFAPNIDWLPADPFEDPTEIPFGYSTPPWIIESIEDPIYGTRPGDLFVSVFGSLVAFPPVVPVSGVPRFQIRVQGPAEVDLQLVKVLQGGIALIFIDGVPHQWYDMQKFNVGDILNVTSWLELFGFVMDNFTRASPELGIPLPLAQEYLIEVQMFPRPALDFSLGYGGAIRKITICSAEEQIDLTQFVTDVRLNDGVLEKEIDSAWIPAQAVTDHVDASVLVRGNDCEIEGLRAWDATWIGLPDTDFVDRTPNCGFLGQVQTFEPGSVGFQHWVNAESYMRMGATALAARFWSKGGPAYIWDSINNRSIGVGNAAKAGIFPGQTYTALDAGWHVIHNSATVDLLKLEAQTNDPPRFMVVENAAGVELVEIASNGWFSAMQQLIVNDLSSTGTKRGQGRVLGQWVDDTDASRTARMILQVDDFAAAREVLRGEATGAGVKLGFLGKTAVFRPVVNGADVFAVLLSMLEAFDDLGLIDNQETMTIEDPYGIEPVETNYEAYWDVQTTQPTASDWQLTTGNWIFGKGFGEVGGPVSSSLLNFSRLLGDRGSVFAWQIEFEVTNLTGGQVNVRIVEEAGFTDLVFFDNNFSNGVHEITVPINRHGDADNVEVFMSTDSNETANIDVYKVWENGLEVPPLDQMRTPDELVIETSVDPDFNLPTV